MKDVNDRKVMIFIDWFLPGTEAGGPVRSCANLIEHLDKGYEFFIVTRNNDYSSDIPYPNIKPNCWTKHNDYTQVYYISQDQLSKDKIEELIESTNFDIAYVNGIYSWYFSILPVWYSKDSKKPIVISARGMLNPQAFVVKGLKKKLFLFFSKFLGLYKNKIFHATNHTEAKHIRDRVGPNANVRVAPNLPRKMKFSSNHDKKRSSIIRFINVARIAKEKGTLILLEALRSINKPLILDLYGPIYDKSYWEHCQKTIENLPPDIKVTYKGALNSDDVPNTIAEYDFFVMLSEGENYGHSIVEAFSVGCPVIISNMTPWLNLEPKKTGWDINLEDKSKIKTAFVKALNMEPEEYQIWSNNAFEYGKSILNNEEVIEQNKALFLT